ncbi:hypothetical protein EUTSA_v10024084mg, partial [Eutrema salsugineum]
EKTRFPGRRRLACESYVGLRARTMTISYAPTVASACPHLVLRAKPTQVQTVRTKENWTLMVTAAAAGEKQKERYLGEPKGFVEEIRFVAMRMHTRSCRDSNLGILIFQFTVEGYLNFLVDNKLVFDTLEQIIHESTVPTYAEFKNTGLERADRLDKDLEWFKEQGYTIPEPMTPEEKNPQAFICHFYIIYFGQSAGGRMVGTKVSKKIPENKELEFYKWDGELFELLQNVRDKIA